ncbi:MAG: hypothetical protein LBJ43_05300 [Propionibacteriaceae bacterium]|jgi:hypothetical protein|nr:hypothetical protein [Propionibacteriaceae bacterium]
MKRREKLPDGVALSNEQYGDFAELFEKANQAYRDGLGAGSIVHLRKIMERITVQTATAIGISVRGKNGSRIPFKNLLDKVEKKHPVIPQEFSADGYRLFSELSDVVHGEYDEQLGLSKFKALHRLVVGILDNVRNNDELRAAKGLLGWELVEAQRDE